MERTKKKKIPSKIQKQVVADSYQELMARAHELDPELAKILQKKYFEEEQAFSEAAREACPSQESSYWAYRSCNKCYGRGIIGHRIIPEQEEKIPVQCRCTTKGYTRWLANFREEYNKTRGTKDDSKVSEHQEKKESNRSEENKEAFSDRPEVQE